MSVKIDPAEEVQLFTLLKKSTITEKTRELCKNLEDNCLFCGLAFMNEQKCCCGWTGDGGPYERRHCKQCHQEAVKRGRIVE